ncbi:hypothetical protein P9112_007349 [Eukaryota sp. TZLM1-RC]
MNQHPYGKTTDNGTMAVHLHKHHLSTLVNNAKERNEFYVSDNQKLSFQRNEQAEMEQLNSHKQEELLSYLVEFAIECDLPFSFFERLSLLKLLRFVNPKIISLP